MIRKKEKKLLFTIIIGLLLIGCIKNPIKKDHIEPSTTLDTDIEMESHKPAIIVTPSPMPITTYVEINYKKLEGNDIRITNIIPKENVKQLVIPSHVDGYMVKELGSRWTMETETITSHHDGLDSVILEEGIEVINEGFFRNTKVKELILPKSLKLVRKLGSMLELETLVINNPAIELETETFANSGLKNITFPKNMTGKIGDRCFANTEIKKLYWPEFEKGSEKNIGIGLFDQCTQLKQVIFPKNQSHIFINQGTFEECIKLETLTIPASTGLVTYESHTYADNYKNSCGTLVIKGKNTELRGCENLKEGEGNCNLLTVGKIIAPKGSKAIAFAKNAVRIKKFSRRYIRNLLKEYTLYEREENHSENDEGDVVIVPMRYEER